MSARSTFWAWEQQNLAGPTKLVLLAIADYSDDRGVSWPSYETISKKCCMDRRTVIRHIKKLQEANYLTINRRISEGKNQSNTFKLNINESIKVVTESHHQGGGSDRESLGVVTESHQGSDRESPKPNNEPNNKEPNNKKGGAKNNKQPDLEALPTWLDFGLWSEYLEMRKKKYKCTNTNRQLNSLIKKLNQFELSAPGDGLIALENANTAEWRDIYKPKKQPGHKTGYDSEDARKVITEAYNDFSAGVTPFSKRGNVYDGSAWQ